MGKVIEVDFTSVLSSTVVNNSAYAGEFTKEEIELI